MTRQTKVPSLPAPTANNQLDFAKAVKGIFDVREGLAGDPLDSNVTFRALVDSGIISVSRNSAGGIGSIGGAPATGGGPPDLTSPPVATGLTVTNTLTSIILQWDAWPYGNHAFTEIWRSETTSIGAAVLIGTSATRFYADAVGRTGRTYYYWIRFRSESDVPGPYNSVSGTVGSTGVINNSDLGPLIIEAGNLAAGSVTAAKFVSSIEPISIVLGALPTALSTRTIFLSSDGKLYRWNGSAYVASVPATDLAGTITTTQIADDSISTPKLVAGSITTSKIAAGAVTANEIAANTIAAGQIAAGAITATKIAANAIAVGTAAIQNGAITNAMIDNLSATKLTAGYAAAVDLEAGVFAGSEFYIGGVVTYEYGDPLAPTQRTGILSVASPAVALNDDGATFNVDYFRIFNGSGIEIPFEIVGGAVRARRANIEDLQVTSAKIDHIIQSSNWNGAHTPLTPSADPHYSSVGLLLNFDASSTADQSSLANAPITATGISFETASPLAGAASIISTSSSQLLYAPSTTFNHRSVYTIEFRIRRTTGQSNGYFMGRSASQYMAIFDMSLSVTNFGAPLTANLSSGVNHHIALCSDGTTLRLFRDGVMVDSSAPSAANLDAQPFGVLGIPGRPDLPPPAAAIDAFRLTQGVARYTANFTPPAGPLPGGPTPGFFTNFGTQGWAISKSGDVAINSLYSRGAIAGGGFSPVDWSWPTSGGGFFVGPQGIRLGREASGQFFEVAAGGAIRAPGLNISGGVLTLGGSAGSAVIQNTSSSAFIDLDASADEPFIQATSAGASTIIYANGKAFFTNEETSGTWFGAAELIGSRVVGGGGKGGGTTLEYFPQEALVEFDTGFRADLLDIRNRSFTARVGNISAARVGGPSGAGAFLEAVQVEASTSSSIPFTVVPFNPANNPYGGTSCAIFIVVRLRLRPSANWAQFTSFQITSLSWVLDRVA